LRRRAPRQTWPRDPRARQGSRLLDLRFHSEVLGEWRHAAVWLPPGYAGARTAYPTVYLFRGHHVEWLKPFKVSASFRLLPEAPPLCRVEAWRVMDALVRCGAVPPVILVMPCMSNADGTLSGMASDWIADDLVKGRQRRGVGTARFGTHLVEIVREVDLRFNTRKERNGRVAVGFSLGGFMALKIVLSHPELFCGVGAYDGSFFYLHQRPGKMGEAPDYLVNHGLFDPVFGRPRDLAYVQANSPAALLANATDRNLRETTFFLQAGPQQAEPGDSNFYRMMHVIRLLQMRGVQNVASPCVLEDGHHDWPTAYRHLAMALQAFHRLCWR